MIPAKFDYVRPSSLDDAVSALASGGEDAKVIAGGQSLLPLLRLRFSYPSVLVDVGGLDALRGVRDLGDSLEIGALTTHYELTRDPLIAAHCGLLAQAAGTIADPAVRHRGTIGGALAHADPAGDLPAVVTALDATLVATGPGGAADDRARRLLHRLPHHVAGPRRDPHRHPGAEARRLGLPVREVPPHRPGLGDRRGRRRRHGGPTGTWRRPGSGSPTWARCPSGRTPWRRRRPAPRHRPPRSRPPRQRGRGHEPAERPARRGRLPAPPGPRPHRPRPGRRGRACSALAESQRRKGIRKTDALSSVVTCRHGH